MKNASTKTDRYTMDAVAAEMNAIAGGAYFAASRSTQTDADGNWVYYITQTRDCPAVKKWPADINALEARARENLVARSEAAAALGRRGGASTSPAKRAASRANGAKGGRPATLHDARSERGECYFWRHIVRRTAKRIIISDYTNVQGGSNYDIHYPRSAEFDAAIDAWVARLNADESEWSEWSDYPVRDCITREPTPFFGVAPCKIVEREIR